MLFPAALSSQKIGVQFIGTAFRQVQCDDHTGQTPDYFLSSLKFHQPHSLNIAFPCIFSDGGIISAQALKNGRVAITNRRLFFCGESGVVITV